MKREQLERHQVWFYLGAVVLGLIAGTIAPQADAFVDTLIWPMLALLLYATFTQVSLSSIPAAFKDRRGVGHRDPPWRAAFDPDCGVGHCSGRPRRTT